MAAAWLHVPLLSCFVRRMRLFCGHRCSINPFPPAQFPFHFSCPLSTLNQVHTPLLFPSTSALSMLLSAKRPIAAVVSPKLDLLQKLLARPIPFWPFLGLEPDYCTLPRRRCHPVPFLPPRLAPATDQLRRPAFRSFRFLSAFRSFHSGYNYYHSNTVFRPGVFTQHILRQHNVETFF